VAIVVLLIILAAAAGYLANNSRIVTSTVTTTSETTTTLAIPEIQTTTLATTVATTFTVATPYNQTSQLYEITFNQTDFCTNFGTLIPWSVVLTTSEGTYNITEPSNSSTPLSECCGTEGSSAYSIIVFSVPNGTYSYETYGYTSLTGNVTIAGHDATVTITDHPASCGSTTQSNTSSTSVNAITDNFENSSLTFQIWSNNTSVQNPISNIAILTNNSVNCQIVQFNVDPASYVFIHPAVVVNNNGSFFGLTYENGMQVSYLANADQDFYYTNGTVVGVIDMTFTLPGHGSCD